MITRFVRMQLIIFSVASVIGVAVMVFTYIQAPTLLGIGRITVTLELPDTGGLYRFSNVTYRGVQLGKVTSIELTDNGAEATLSLATSPKVPADLHAEVRSVSAVGEQYVELLPNTDSSPYLQDGSVIAMEDTTIPQPVGPMMDQLSAMVGSIPKEKLSDLLDESFQAFNGAGYDFGSLLDSAETISRDADSVSDQTRTLIDDSGPLLDSQAQTADAIREWSANLAGITGQVRENDPEIRTLLQRGPGFAQEVSGLLSDIKPTLPILLANLRTLGQVLVTYNPSLEQVLVLYPGFAAATQSFAGDNNASGLPIGDFTMTLNDPPPCTTGFLPPSQWRSPADTSIVDTPDGLYCKLPQDSPSSVRGARNYPCMGVPGKRAPTVEICYSDKPYQPLAMRSHTLGPYPIDPNLISQGVPPDDRVTFEDNIHGPIEGTPMPPQQPGGSAGAAPAGPVPPPAPPTQPAPPAQPAPPPGNSLNGVPIPGPGAQGPSSGTAAGGGVPAAPSSFGANDSDGPSIALAKYDPKTGKYLTPDGKLEQLSHLDTGPAPKTWTDLMPT